MNDDRILEMVSKAQEFDQIKVILSSIPLIEDVGMFLFWHFDTVLGTVQSSNHYTTAVHLVITTCLLK